MNQEVLRRNVIVNNLHGAWQSLAMNLFNPFLGVYAIRLGATNTQVALMSSLPAAVAVISSLPATAMLRGSGYRRQVTAGLYLANRLFLLAIAALPALTSDRRASYLVAAVALMNLPGAIASISWQTLMAEVIPEQSRGEAFASRNRIMVVVGLLPALLAGYALDVMSFPLGYQMMFVGAFAVSVVEVALLLGLREGQGDRSFRLRRGGVRVYHSSRREQEALRPGSLRYTAITILLYFGWQMGWPLFTIYYVRVLEVGTLWIGVFSVVSSVAHFLALPWWSRRASQFGNVKTIAFAGLGMSLTPVFIAISPVPWLVAVFGFSMGFFASGASMLLLNGLLEYAPVQGRTACISYHNGIVNLSAFAAPLVGKVIADSVGIRWALVIAAMFRFAGSLVVYLGAVTERSAGQGLPDATISA